jgi:hypothetical protein
VNEQDHDYDDDDGNPYCECGLEPYEEEQAANRCACCGKLLD